MHQKRTKKQYIIQIDSPSRVLELFEFALHVSQLLLQLPDKPARLLAQRLDGRQHVHVVDQQRAVHLHLAMLPIEK